MFGSCFIGHARLDMLGHPRFLTPLPCHAMNCFVLTTCCFNRLNLQFFGRQTITSYSVMMVVVVKSVAIIKMIFNIDSHYNQYPS